MHEEACHAAARTLAAHPQSHSYTVLCSTTGYISSACHIQHYTTAAYMSTTLWIWLCEHVCDLQMSRCEADIAHSVIMDCWLTSSRGCHLYASQSTLHVAYDVMRVYICRGHANENLPNMPGNGMMLMWYWCWYYVMSCWCWSDIHADAILMAIWHWPFVFPRPTIQKQNKKQTQCHMHMQRRCITPSR